MADPVSFLGILDEASVDRLVGDVAALGTLLLTKATMSSLSRPNRIFPA